MRVIVVGVGEVGFDVARILAQEQHDVVVIDRNQRALDNAREKLDVLTVWGNGTSADNLVECGVRKAELLIAVTAVDEVNIIACMMAKRLGVGTTVARVRSDEIMRKQSVLKATDFGIDLVIHPEESAAGEIVRLVHRASATDVLTFADGRLHLVGMRLDPEAPVLGKTLDELTSENAHLTFRIMGIGRGIRTILPNGSTRLSRNDQVFVLARPKEIPHVARLMGKSDKKIQHTMIMGGTMIGAKVAYELATSKNKRIKLIVPDRTRAEQLAGDLNNVLVIHGEASDIDLLVVEGIGEMDAFVAVTDDEESNLVTCLMAKHLGVKKTIALLSKAVYIPISQSIGLDAAVNKKLAVAGEILRFLRGKHVLSVATIHGLDIEIMELEAKRRAKITHKPLKELALPKGMLIGALVRGRHVEVATGEMKIEPGDRVLVFALPRFIDETMRVFER